MPQYTDAYVSELISAVEKEFTTYLGKSEALAKAEDSSEKEEKKEESKEEPKDKKEKPAHETDEEEKEESKETPEAAEDEEEHAEEGKEAAEDAEHGEEDHGYDDEDMDHMHGMYSSMSHGELKAHHDAVRKCLDSKGMAKCGEMGMQKSEKDLAVTIKAEATKEIELVKSELLAQLEVERAKSSELKKNLDAVSEFLTKFAKKTAPAGKAITSLDVITKGESANTEEKALTKSEVTERLVKKATDPKLSTSDKEAINAYYLQGGSMDKIRHLLK